jgi:hypothetical protein
VRLENSVSFLKSQKMITMGTAGTAMMSMGTAMMDTAGTIHMVMIPTGMMLMATRHTPIEIE